MKKLLCAFLAAVVACTAFVGCKRDPQGEEIDPNRTQIYVALYNGGLGRDWLDAADAAFEAKYSQYQVIVNVSKQQFDGQMIYDNFASYNQDIFFLDYVADELYRQFINSGKIADIGEAMTEPLTEFGETESVYDKISPFLKDYYKAADSDAMYALPWYQSSYQIIYDKELFTEKALYMSELYGVTEGGIDQEMWWTKGDGSDGLKKSLGQDGEEDTYDDGLPVTYDDFFAMMDRMIEVGVIPFTWAGGANYYFVSLLLNLTAKYEGYNDIMLNYTLSGTDSDCGPIDLENGYLLRDGQAGKRYALQFAYDVIRGRDGGYISDNTFNSIQDNSAAQNEFLYSRENTKGNPVAMLVDGAWWEKESENIFDEMATRYDEKYAYGTREFGVMPLPIGNDQQYTENTVACVSGRSMVFVNSNVKNKTANAANTSVEEGAMLFLQFLHTDDVLSETTALSNTPRPYDCEMNDDDLAAMTPYGREYVEYCESSDLVFDNIPLHDFLESEGAEYIGYMRQFRSVINGVEFIGPARQFRTNSSVTVESWLTGMALDESEWTENVEAYLERVGA